MSWEWIPDVCHSGKYQSRQAKQSNAQCPWQQKELDLDSFHDLQEQVKAVVAADFWVSDPLPQ